jgi:hypothetical protein
VTDDGNVLALDNGDVYAVSSGDASSWQGHEVIVGRGTLTDVEGEEEKLEVKRVGNLSVSKRYSGPGEGMLDTKASNGSILVLSDGSVWSVESVDRVNTGVWLEPDSIMVNQRSGPAYELVNTDEHPAESATASYVGEK